MTLAGAASAVAISLYRRFRGTIFPGRRWVLAAVAADDPAWIRTIAPPTSCQIIWCDRR
jgi:hypothetical protein